MRRMILLATFCALLGYPRGESLRLTVTLAKEVAPEGAGGRLFVLLADDSDPSPVLSAGFLPSRTALAAMEVRHLAPGERFLFDPDRCAYPKPFSHMEPGRYRLMALLDQDHSLPYAGEDGDDLYGPVVEVRDFNEPEAPTVSLDLDRRMKPDPQRVDSANVKLAEFVSPALSAFFGRPITMRAGVVLPSAAISGKSAHFACVYHVHGFGGNCSEAWAQGPSLVEGMDRGTLHPMVHVFLDGACPTGHHEFADSVNNGPWGRALTEEFIPWLEKRYPMIPAPSARFLTGHSSGGWSTLWLQVRYPTFFGGTWSTSPDPVDFRSFAGFDATPGSRDNAYCLPDGTLRNLVRMGGRDAISLENFVRHEEVEGDYGGQFASFEWVFSPRGADGRPMPLFDRVTGKVDTAVARAWEAYDIRLHLERNWATLGPLLAGKIHVFCGSEDTFHLEEPTRLLCAFLKGKGSDAVCEVVPGRDHFNLYASYRAYPDGLEARIDREMKAALARSNH